MSDKELKDFFQAAEYRTCFASCKTSESSHSTAVLKHGVWTYQVIQALEGNDPLALEGRRYVTAMSLQNYLAKEIPRTIRKVFTKPVTQTPWLYGSQTSDFVISDLDAVLKKRNAVKPGYDQVKRILLQLDETVKISSLSGFSKQRGHRVPDSVNSATERFVENISKREIEDEVNEVFERIRGSMKYKRRDLTAAAGRILTPDFEFVVECRQDSDDPAMAVVTRQLINMSPAIVPDDSFNDVFDDSFNELTFEFAKGVNVQDLIDQIEDLELDKIDLDYPADCSHCDISIEGSPIQVRVRAGSLTVTTPNSASPKLLMESFFDVQKQLVGSPVLKAIAGK
jgi:hypothetical protein